MKTEREQSGFSLLELIVVMAIIGILATAAVPMATWSVKRQQEVELRRALRSMRTAIDAYHDAAVGGLIEVELRQQGYPPDLRKLVEGAKTLAVVAPGDRRDSPIPKTIKFLRRIPEDPMTGEADWGLRCYEDKPASRFWCRKNVFDVYSKSNGTGIDGTRYRDW